MKKAPSREQLNAAKKLRDGRPGDSEDQIRSNLVRFFDTLDVEALLEQSTASGRADVVLPNRRILIETKVVGAADNPSRPQSGSGTETPFEQLARYVRAEVRAELQRLDLGDQSDRPWVGLVTDGRVWHAWEFPHVKNPTPELVLDAFRPAGEQELYDRIAPLVLVAPVHKPAIPANPVPLFQGDLDALRRLHAGLAGHRLQTTETKMALWLDMLRGSGMAPESSAAEHRLFTAHCFLVALARGVVHTLTSPSDDPDPAALLGDGFLSWIVETEEGRTCAQTLLDRVHQYDWRRTAGDVLRPLYERFVDEADRRDFGEVYTPDWLAEWVVGDVLDDQWCADSVSAALQQIHGKGSTDGIGVLDPTCGSGTFLFHAARRILETPAVGELQPGQRADVVCRLVHGIDIHPVAVEFSRATLLRALPVPPPLGETAPMIYQGDALMLRQSERGSLFTPSEKTLLFRSPSGKEIVLPRSFTELPAFPDLLRRMVDAARQQRALPPDVKAAAGSEDNRQLVSECHRTLAEVIQDEGNSVWAWYINNVLGPDRLARRKVNRIVANPPWVKLAHIQVAERKIALERLSGKGKPRKHLDMWMGGKQAPHLDIAQLFVRHSRETYLNDPNADPAGWVVKAAALRAGHWRKFREWHHPHLSQSVDLAAVRAFGGGDATRSCVLFEHTQSSLSVHGASATPREIEGVVAKRPNPSAPWDEVWPRIQWGVPRAFPVAQSDLRAREWRQGATIVPKVLTQVGEVADGSSPALRAVITVRSDKRPWDSFRVRSGEVPAHWLLPLLTSRHLLPFFVRVERRGTAIVPCDDDGNMLTDEEARKEGFWRELDDLYREGRGLGSNTPGTLIQQIDYAGKLTAQLPLKQTRRHIVVYPSSGDIMRAAHVPERVAVLDSTLFRRPMRSVAEARYLVALLNAPCLERAFRASRGSGRHFQTNPWRKIPIPRYDRDDETHQELAKLAGQAERAVAKLDLPAGQVAASKRIREYLADDSTLSRMDALARVVLPDHST